ncbi:MAG: hypothetical protein GC179_24255 [Anaerolineaceae bacterium]|nr:hypothetical protein [Anaerolineaceae bacterium]
MQPYSDYEIAQWRIEHRQNRKTQFQASLFILITAIFVSVIGGSASVCSVPIALLALICAIILRINLYYSAPENAPSANEINQEIAWLFGEDQDNFSAVQMRALAQDRIRKRGLRQWRFLGHLLLFVPINGGICLIALQTIIFPMRDANIVFGILTLLIVGAWLVILIADFQGTFPSIQEIESQEINFGKTLHFELAKLQPKKLKQKEKLKRGKYYQVGDDGELEEVEDEEILVQEKPKRAMRDDG